MPADWRKLPRESFTTASQGKAPLPKLTNRVKDLPSFIHVGVIDERDPSAVGRMRIVTVKGRHRLYFKCNVINQDTLHVEEESGALKKLTSTEHYRIFSQYYVNMKPVPLIKGLDVEIWPGDGLRFLGIHFNSNYPGGFEQFNFELERQGFPRLLHKSLERCHEYYPNQPLEHGEQKFHLLQLLSVVHTLDPLPEPILDDIRHEMGYSDLDLRMCLFANGLGRAPVPKLLRIPPVRTATPPSLPLSARDLNIMDDAPTSGSLPITPRGMVLA